MALSFRRLANDPAFFAGGCTDDNRPLFFQLPDWAQAYDLDGELDEVLEQWIDWVHRGRPSARWDLERRAAGKASKADIAARVAFYGGLCWICREAPGNCIDHVKPLNRGGSNWPANLRPACRSCNSRKRDKWPFAPALAGRGGV